MAGRENELDINSIYSYIEETTKARLDHLQDLIPPLEIIFKTPGYDMKIDLKQQKLDESYLPNLDYHPKLLSQQKLLSKPKLNESNVHKLTAEDFVAELEIFHETHGYIESEAGEESEQEKSTSYLTDDNEQDNSTQYSNDNNEQDNSSTYLTDDNEFWIKWQAQHT